MIILTEKLAIKSNKDCWILCRWKGLPKTEKGTGDGWEPFKYYASVAQLVKGTAALLLRQSDYDSFEQLLANSNAIARLVDDKLGGLE